MSHHTPNHRSGFTLVELSIVMVIIGMLVGGIMAGQSLIRASNLQTILTDAQKYKSAAAAFKEKYMALPGDFSDANASFGGTNGNGDGLINWAAAASVTGEAFEFWRHLQLDGQIQGSFSGLAGSGGIAHSVIGSNVPRSKITNVGWGASMCHFCDVDTLAPEAFEIDYGYMFYIGSPIANSVTTAPFLKPEEAWNLDTKIDDGKPSTGAVIARYWDTCTDAVDNNSTTANYLLSDNTIQCSLHFIKAF